ncbi:MAG: redoxin domain-containing protein [Pyrinomonadaceae bacterium]
MRFIFTGLIVVVLAAASFGQGEQAPIIEKDVVYKDWSYKNVASGENVNLREFTKGKKLVLVAYYAPWCPNWKVNAPIIQRLYDKYKAKGLGVIGVGEYDPVESMKTNFEALKLTFPSVYESDTRAAKQTSLHYKYRKATGDARGWGSPWYLFLMPSKMEKSGDVLTKKAFVVNGEIVEEEAGKFIGERLGGR